jgi:hypothetical protein
MEREPITENGICKRCERKTTILSNGLYSRCDNVLYGHQPQRDCSPWYTKQTPLKPYPDTLRKRKLWCYNER